MIPGPRTARALLVLASSLALAGCGRLAPRASLTSNQLPEIVLDTPTVPQGDQPFSFTWRARDPDGRIDHYVYAVNPRSVDRVDPSWTTTGRTQAIVQLPRRVAIGRIGLTARASAEPRIFSVRAVDDQGALSAPATAAVFDSTGLAPVVVILSPIPNAFFTAVTPSSVTMRWSGTDPDGHVTAYKYQLFGAQNPDFPDIPDFVQLVSNDPDTLRRLYLYCQPTCV